MWGFVCRSGDGVVCLVGLRGAGPALAGRLWGGRVFALRAGEERVFASNARSDPAPRAPGGWGGAEVGASKDGGARGLRRFHGGSLWGVVCRSGDGVVCLVGLRGVGPALAGRLWGGRAFALCAGEERVFASNARSDPAPRAPVLALPLGGRLSAAGSQRQRCASSSTRPASTSSRSRPARLRANWAVRKPCLAPMS